MKKPLAKYLSKILIEKSRKYGDAQAYRTLAILERKRLI